MEMGQHRFRHLFDAVQVIQIEPLQHEPFDARIDIRADLIDDLRSRAEYSALCLLGGCTTFCEFGLERGVILGKDLRSSTSA